MNDIQNSKHFVWGPHPSDPDELRRELKLDPVQFEVIRHKLDSINEELGIALKSVSISEIVTEAGDYNVGLYTTEGKTVNMGTHVVHHSGSLPHVIDNVRSDCDNNPGIQRGDMFAVNDPYKGVVHHPDFAVVSPIYYDGKQLGWSGAEAHLVDIGGLTVGSISAKATEKQQEGLMLPPVKLVESGELKKDIWNYILNMTRQPEMVALDIKGLMASNYVAQQRMTALCDTYGFETVKVAMDEVIRYSERTFRERLREFPNGTFTAQGFLDHDGHENRVYRTHLTLTKSDDLLRLDFSRSSNQAPGAINCTKSGLISASFGGVAPLMTSGIPWNHGILNGMEIVCPEGKICNAESPVPVGAATIAEAWVVGTTTVQAVSKLLAIHPGYRQHSQGVTNGTLTALSMGGTNQYGEPWGTQLIDAVMGGGGASCERDGLDQSGAWFAATPKIPNVETTEHSSPILYLYRSFLQDSGGDGARRGGRAVGVGFVPHDVDRIRSTLTTHGVEAPVSPGCFGGYPGSANRHLLTRNSNVKKLMGQGELPLDREALICVSPSEIGGNTRRLPAKVDELQIESKDVFQYRFQGGGGFGDPLDRPPGEVLNDIRNNHISIPKAKQVYGVVLGDDGELDQKATRRERSKQRGERLRRSQDPEKRMEGTVDSVMARWGPVLRLVTMENVREETAIQCECGRFLGPLRENWRKYAAFRSVRPGLRLNMESLHATLEVGEFLCPDCGRLLSVDVYQSDQGFPNDIE